MSDIERAFTGFFDQLNPFTLVAVWRSHRSWVRLICFVINQVFSIGVLISWTLTLLLAYTYWLPSAFVFLGTGGTTFYLFRRRR